MVRREPLLAWPGYPSPAVADNIVAEMVAGERFIAGPLAWTSPAIAPLYPRAVTVRRQKATAAFCTDRALYSVAYTNNAIEGVARTGFDQIASFKWQRAVRARLRQVLPGCRHETVVLLHFTTSGDAHTWESRYNEAEDFARALQHAIGAFSSGSSVSMGDELVKLAELRSTGVLSADEWDRAKNLWLGKPAHHRADSITILSQLYDLHLKGALSEGEFNNKKWEILAKDSVRN